MDRLRVLVTSVGSLVGQNILDALEGRRDRVHLIGTNLEACNARLFRCDAVYLMPPTDESDAFLERLLGIIEREQPDLWLAARDQDVLVQAGLRESHPHLTRMLTVGARAAALMMQDKWLSYRFAVERGLPFAESVIGGPDRQQPVLEFARRHGFPLLAKPRRGYGSHGIFAVRNETQLRRALRDREMLFQQFLEPPEELADYARRLRLGLPLFFAIAEKGQHVCQTVIGPGGDIGPMFCSISRNVLGRSERTEPVDDPALARIGRRYAEAVAAIGWVGPFNLQCKRDPTGAYVAFEMNGRLTGTTSARLAMGYDEIGILARSFAGPGRLPDWTLSPPPQCLVIKSLTDGVVDLDQVERLTAEGVWRAAFRSKGKFE